MSAAALAAHQAAPHAQPPSAAAAVRPRDGGLTVKVPLRLVVGPQYPDAALSTYVKVKALALRPEGCTARVDTLAAYLGVSKSSAERGLRPLRHPDPVDGIVEVPTVRRTARGGTGESAHRVTRPLAEGELWVRIPVRAAEALTPRLLRLYALLAYATARGIPVTVAELGEMLRHHTGKRAGEALGERQARRLIDQLGATGWLTVRRREGAQGRHAYETHRHPLRTVPAPSAVADVPADQAAEQLPLWGAEAPVIHDGSGADDLDGSLASKEDPQTDRPDETHPVGVIRRRRGDREWVAGPVDNSRTDAFGRPSLVLRMDDETAGAGPAPCRPAYTGPALQLSPRVWRVLAPVRHELTDVRTYVLRRIAREIGTQLDAPFGSEDRLIDRIARRYATTEPVRDIGRWLLGAALVRHGCGDPACESGQLWPAEGGGGAWAPCETCALNRQVEAARARRDAELDRREREQVARLAQRLGVLEDQARRGAAVLPPKKTFRERDRATDAEILAAAAEHGPAVALHMYGPLRALPLLHGRSPSPETGTDRRTNAQ
ncbi:hypothetical protein ABZZ79_03405 [Streptomyces sp. NPDC006458]|uniref:hypothetical protein n=1 Tax=Streptomyces sp. NPDC006458 TaxID=3154302 RepID=UPI0033B584EE